MQQIPNTTGTMISLGKLRWLYDIPFPAIPQLALQLDARYNCAVFPAYQNELFAENSFEKIISTINEEGRVFSVKPGLPPEMAYRISHDGLWGWAIFAQESDMLIRAGHKESHAEEYNGYPLILKFTEDSRKDKIDFYGNRDVDAVVYIALLDTSIVDIERAVIYLYKEKYDTPTTQKFLARDNIAVTRGDIDKIISEYKKQKKSPQKLWKERKKSLSKDNEKRACDIADLMFKGRSQAKIYDELFKDREEKRKKLGKSPSTAEEKRKEVGRHNEYIKRIAQLDPKNVLPLPDSLK